MPHMADEFLFPSRPTGERPLLGQTVLVVEDSRFASEALRLMCLRSGARIRRADTLAAAARHLKVYRPTVAVIDLGLPDGSGHDLIRDLSQVRPRVPVLIAITADPASAQDPLSSGADAFLEKPLTSVGLFVETILSRLPRDMAPSGPRPVWSDMVTPDPMALQDDLTHVSDLLDNAADFGRLAYVTRFLGGLGRSMGDTPLTDAVETLRRLTVEGRPTESQVSVVSALVRDRLQSRPIAI